MNNWISYPQRRSISNDNYKIERNNNYNRVVLPANDFRNRNYNDFNRGNDFQNDNGIRKINNENFYLEKNKYKFERNNNNYQMNSYGISNQRNYQDNNYGSKRQYNYRREEEELNYD